MCVASFILVGKWFRVYSSVYFHYRYLFIIIWTRRYYILAVKSIDFERIDNMNERTHSQMMMLWWLLKKQYKNTWGKRMKELFYLNFFFCVPTHCEWNMKYFCRRVIYNCVKAKEVYLWISLSAIYLQMECIMGMIIKKKNNGECL